MVCKCKIAGAVLLAGILATSPAFATVNVGVAFDPGDQTQLLGAVFTVDIVADIPLEDACLGWGLDFTIVNGTIVSQLGGPTINTLLWTPLTSPDGDDLAGMEFPPGAGISGSNVLLCTLTLSADAIGETDLLLSDDNPPDLTEGFQIDGEGFANVTYTPGHVNVIPEPASLVLLALGGLAVLRRR